MGIHKDLNVWKESIVLAREVYQYTSNFPREEQFGIVAQMRKAAVSVGSNIAEGAARNGEREFVRFLYMAVGSATELDTQLEISKAIGFGDMAHAERVQDRLANVTKMLYGLIRASKQKITADRNPRPGPSS